MLSTSRLALAAAFLLMLPAAAAVAAEAVGVNAAIRNSVQMKTETDAALRPAMVREQVHIGDAFASGPQSSLQMLLLDTSTFTIGANANITIDRFVYDPTRGTSDIAASVAKGAFRFMSGRLAPGAGQGAIRTPVATIGVRGTVVAGVVGSDVADVLGGGPGVPMFAGNLDNAVLIVLSGPGLYNQGFDNPGAVDLTIDGAPLALEHAGQAVLIWGPGQPVFGPFELTPEMYARLTALLNGMQGGIQVTDDFGAANIGAAELGPAANFVWHPGSGTVPQPAAGARAADSMSAFLTMFRDCLQSLLQ